MVWKVRELARVYAEMANDISLEDDKRIVFGFVAKDILEIVGEST